MASKYIDHTPIHRKLQMPGRQKITIEDNTVNNWFKNGCNLIVPLFETHEQQVMQTHYLAVDETPLKVLDKIEKGTTHQGCYRVYCNTASREALFKQQTGRSAAWPKETLKNYQAISKQMDMPPTINLMMWKASPH